MTAAAARYRFVHRYQRLRGLMADGIVGPQTRADLTALLGSPPTVEVNRAVVARMFPGARASDVDHHLPAVLAALTEAWLDDEPMVRMALATIRAETGRFLPISEGISKHNTDPGAHPFNRYDDRGDLGNTGRPDGADYKGRGFVQLTGRANYRRIGLELGVPLEAEPERANDPATAARVLAAFLGGHESAIRDALDAGDITRARRLVNGGRHGLGDFTAAWRAGEGLLA